MLLQGRDHYDTVIAALDEAETSIWIGTANVKEMLVERPGRRSRRRGRNAHGSVLEILAGRARRGVELRLLHAGRPSKAFRSSFDEFDELVEGGLEMRMCPRVHFKVVIIDGARMYLGSANWTGAGLGAKGDDRRNFELGIWTEDEDMIDEVQATYDRIWRGGACGTCKLRDECESPLDLG